MRSLAANCAAPAIILNTSRILLPDLKNLRQKIKLSDTDEGDGIALSILRCLILRCLWLTSYQLYQP